MQITTVDGTLNSFSQTIFTQARNDCDIQRASIIEEYNNPEILHYETTSQKIRLNENLLMTKYYEKIKNSCKAVKLSPEMNTKYKYRPEAFSTDQYGFPGLWYIVLYVNGCEDFLEFCNFDYVLVPNIDTIQECLLYEEFINKKEKK